MSKGLEAARAKVPCPECGVEISGNNLSRHRASKHAASSNGTAGRKPGSTLSPAQRKQFSSLHARSRAVGRYLDQLEAMSDARANGQRFRTGAALGRLEGFPNFSSDPDEIERAADQIQAQADEAASSVAALRLVQRAIELREVANELRETGGVNEIEQTFIAVAAEWAEANGISYAAFRSMGVTAGVLRAAGIAP